MISLRKESPWVQVFRIGYGAVGIFLVAMSVTWGQEELVGGNLRMVWFYAPMLVLGMIALWRGLTGTGKMFEEARADVEELREIMTSKGQSTAAFDHKLPETKAEELKKALHSHRPSNIE